MDPIKSSSVLALAIVRSTAVPTACVAIVVAVGDDVAQVLATLVCAWSEAKPRGLDN